MLRSGDPRLDAVEEELAQLEALCGQAERALMTRRWSDLQRTMDDSRRVTHALANAMDDARGVRSEQFDRDVFARLRYVGAIRDNQMARLAQYRDAVGQRLQTVTRWKSALRSFARPRATSRLASLDRLT